MSNAEAISYGLICENCTMSPYELGIRLTMPKAFRDSPDRNRRNKHHSITEGGEAL